MKAILISIQPKWCELIANGEKTIEVRKTRPKIKTPFKCYIYCTIGGGWMTSVNGVVQKPNEISIDRTVDSVVRELNGKVIGEFICDEIIDLRDMSGEEFYPASCMTYEDWRNYTDYTKHIIYGWRISDLKIYDEPKELSEFKQGNACPYLAKGGCNYPYYCFRAGKIERCGDYLEKAPQSWCYVEELK